MARIVVIGSAAQDEVVRLEQPLREGRHLDARQRTLRLGGGGINTAIPLRHAGHQVVLVAPIGEDPVGDWLLGQIEASGIDLSGIRRVSGASTRSLVLLDPEGERTIVNLHRCREDGPPVRLRSIDGDAIYVRSRDLDLSGLLAERTAASLVVAHVPPLAARSRPAGVLVGSESDLPDDFVADPWGRGRAIAGESLRCVVVTRGACGAQGWSAEGCLSVAAPSVEVVDSTAAGDVFAAGLVHGLLQDRALNQALHTAVAWGAAKVGRAGLPDEQTIRRLA